MLKVLYVLLMNKDYTIGCCCSFSSSNSNMPTAYSIEVLQPFQSQTLCSVIQLRNHPPDIFPAYPANVGRPSHVAAPILLNDIVHPEPICYMTAILSGAPIERPASTISSRSDNHIEDTRSRNPIPSDSAAGTSTDFRGRERYRREQQ